MRSKIQEITGWAPLAAALSLTLYGIALQLRPVPAGRFFAAVLALDPQSLQPIQEWSTVVAGLLLWVAGSYAAAAAGCVIWREARAIRSHHTSRSSMEAAAWLQAPQDSSR
jgi:hypothetical protein